MPAIEFLPDGRQACTKCDGCGRIANDDEGTPWSFWENLPIRSGAAVMFGLVKPITCPRCHGGKADPDPVPHQPFIADQPVSLDETDDRPCETPANAELWR